MTDSRQQAIEAAAKALFGEFEIGALKSFKCDKPAYSKSELRQAVRKIVAAYESALSHPPESSEVEKLIGELEAGRPWSNHPWTNADEAVDTIITRLKKIAALSPESSERRSLTDELRAAAVEWEQTRVESMPCERKFFDFLCDWIESSQQAEGRQNISIIPSSGQQAEGERCEKCNGTGYAAIQSYTEMHTVPCPECQRRGTSGQQAEQPKGER